MLFYNFAQTSTTQNNGKYAPIMKLPYKDRNWHIFNAEFTIHCIGQTIITPLKCSLYSSYIESSNYILTTLNDSDIDVFIRNEGQYSILYAKCDVNNGTVILTFDSANNANLFTPIWGGEFTIEKISSDISPILKKGGVSVKYSDVTGTTTSSGALQINIRAEKIISCKYLNGTGLVFARGDGYVTCMDNSLQVKASQNVSVRIFYFE